MRTLNEAIRKRVIEEGDCWHWTGALQACGVVPTMKYKGKVGAVRRFILLAQNVDLTGRLATYTCGNPQCVNPKHTAAATQRDIQRRTAFEQNHQNTLPRRKKVSDKARKHAKLTPEQARQVRDAEGAQAAIAAQFGVSQATVSSIKRGKTWKTYSTPFAGLVL